MDVVVVQVVVVDVVVVVVQGIYMVININLVVYDFFGVCSHFKDVLLLKLIFEHFIGIFF